MDTNRAFDLRASNPSRRALPRRELGDARSRPGRPGRCLAREAGRFAGRPRLRYLEGSQITVNLSGLEQPRAEWIDTWTGVREKAALSAAPVQRNLKKPESFGKAPAVLSVRGGV